MRNLILLKDHPSNLDKTAVLVREDRQRSISIYRVKGGFVAARYPMALPGLFPTDDTALTAITADA